MNNLDKALDLAIEELGNCALYIESTIQTHYWSMGKEYLAKEAIENSYQLKAVKDVIAKINELRET